MPSLMKGLKRQFTTAALGLVLGVQYAHAGNDNAVTNNNDDPAGHPRTDPAETVEALGPRADPDSGGRQTGLHDAMDDAFGVILHDMDLQIDQTIDGRIISRELREAAYQDAADQVMARLDSGMDGAATDPDTGTPYFVYAIRLAYKARRPELVRAFLENGADPALRIDTAMPFPAIPDYAGRDNTQQHADKRPNNVMDLATLQFLKGQFRSRQHADTALETIMMLERAGASLDDISAGAHYIDGDISAYKDLAHNLVGWQALAAYDLATQDEVAQAAQMPGREAIGEIGPDAATDKAFLAENGAAFADYDHLYPGNGKITYTVQKGDTLLDIAGRFQPMIGADNRQDAFDTLKSANAFGTRGADHIKAGANIIIPVAADKTSVYAGYNSLSVLYGVAADIREKIETDSENTDDLPSLDQLVTDLIRDNKERLKTDWHATLQRIIEPLQPGQTLSLNTQQRGYSLEDGAKTTIDITRTHAIHGIVHHLHNRIAPAYNDESQATLEHTRALIESYNNIDLDALEAGRAELDNGRRIWAHAPATLPDHVPALQEPDIDTQDNDVHLAVIENGEPSHHKNTYEIAANTMAGVNDESDPSLLMAWRENLPETFLNLQYKSSALQMMLNSRAVQNPDTLIFSYSAALQVDHETATIEAQSQLPDNSNHVLMATYLDDLYANAPVVIRSAGNARQRSNNENTGSPLKGMGNYATSDIIAYSPRTVTIGAADHRPAHAPADEEVIRDYSNYGGAICLNLPEEKGVTMEGTSYATPSFAAVMRQMMDWYGQQLTFEEVFAAAAMVSSQDIKDFDPFGGVYKTTSDGRHAAPAEFVTNGAGVAYHGRCGFGYLGQEEMRRWNTLLQDMATWKQGRDLDAGVVNRQLDVGEATRVAAGQDNDSTQYVYKVEIPVDMTLDKLAFLLPQERFNRSGATVETPAGFEYNLPDTMDQASYTRAFSYEDVEAGEELTIRTQTPLIDGAQVYLYGLEDGNVIQAAREQLRDEGRLYPPLHRLESDEVAGPMDAGRARRMVNLHFSAVPQ